MSHDWPEGVYNFGDKEGLLRRKPFFKESVENRQLGCPDYMPLLKSIKPQYWLSGHMHVRFEASIPHSASSSPKGEKSSPGTTHFRAFDKAIPQRDFLGVIQVEGTDGPATLTADKEWLGILRAIHSKFDVFAKTFQLQKKR